jgi:hypothetical protein
MHATQVARPFHTKGWVNEEKIDGWRMLALKEAGRVRLVSRNDRDHTKRFGDLVAALTALNPETFTLDGEIAVFDGHPISRFEWIRHLNHGDLATPPLFMVFDLLHLDATDYRPQPLTVRRKALEKLLSRQTLSFRFAPFIVFLIPLYLLFQRLGLYNTHLGLILAYQLITLPFMIWMLRSFFMEIPLEVEEAARIDGCSWWGVLTRVILPLSLPGLAVTVILGFMFSWNAFNYPLMLAGRQTFPVTVGAIQFICYEQVLWG